MDSATATLSRPSVARLQVEVDLLKEIPPQIWIGLGDNKGFWQYFEADGIIPSYCSYCSHVGHSKSVCTVKHPELKALDTKDDTTALLAKASRKGAVCQAYRVVQNIPTPLDNPTTDDGPSRAKETPTSDEGINTHIGEPSGGVNPSSQRRRRCVPCSSEEWN
ncbi:hypothetical protein K2173_008881 [Erythroxylum novogranatense]|uniref:Uncharacterized protein n=1 Tax=Erythroxylum novogranatense TaxID=1862640 RepID=A0AAV8TS56_9ROSI|nr:hypothetical protein K2173_008881 [Erythroxylum novogranatense]